MKTTSPQTPAGFSLNSQFQQRLCKYLGENRRPAIQKYIGMCEILTSRETVLILIPSSGVPSAYLLDQEIFAIIKESACLVAGKQIRLFFKRETG